MLALGSSAEQGGRQMSLDGSAPYGKLLRAQLQKGCWSRPPLRLQTLNCPFSLQSSPPWSPPDRGEAPLAHSVKLGKQACALPPGASELQGSTGTRRTFRLAFAPSPLVLVNASGVFIAPHALNLRMLTKWAPLSLKPQPLSSCSCHLWDRSGFPQLLPAVQLVP